jgi:HEAT repeat protein
MFDIHVMKNEANNYNVIPRRILSLAILVALTILAVGTTRQSAAQEPAPRAKAEAKAESKAESAPRAKVEPSFRLKTKDASSLDKLERLSLLDNLDLNLDFSLFDKWEKFGTTDNFNYAFRDKFEIDQGKGFGVSSGVGSGNSQAPADDDPCEFKIEVLQALFRSDPARGTAVATDWLKSGSSQTQRCKGAALSLLARYTGKSATPVILGVAKNDPDPKLRAKAISVLGATNDDTVVDALRDFALNSTDTDISEAALYALSQHTSERAMGVLAEIATSNRPVPLRKAAIANISSRVGEPYVDMLFKIYDTDQNVEIRKSVIGGLSRRKSERAGAKLLEIAKGADNIELRKAAIGAIARRSGDASIDILLGLYDTEKNEELRDQIINSLGGSNDQRVVRKLIAIARNPQTPMERRKRAIGWLSRSKDPEVLQFLEELLKQ